MRKVVSRSPRRLRITASVDRNEVKNIVQEFSGYLQADLDDDWYNLFGPHKSGQLTGPMGYAKELLERIRDSYQIEDFSPEYDVFKRACVEEGNRVLRIWVQEIIDGDISIQSF